MQKYSLVLALLFVATCFPAVASYGQLDSAFNQRIAAAANLRSSNPDESLRLLEGIIEEALMTGDTAQAVMALVEEAGTFGHQANYKEAYDRLWKALSLADRANLKGVSARVYVAIGRYYSFYKRKEKALSYFQRSLEINQERIAAGEAEPGVLADNYYAFVSTYRELDEPGNAQKYLDSCWKYHNPEVSIINQPYLVFEGGCILDQMGKHAEALSAYQSTIPWMEQYDVGYQTLVYTYMGDVLSRMGRLQESEAAYKQALRISKATNSHRDFSPLIYEKL
ncbi:MAG: tetratricopeptide repeat protein, partial [Bacteroidota bacterium]